MKQLSAFFIILGLFLQFLIPLQIVDFGSKTLVGVPVELATVLIGTALIVVGILIYFFKSYLPYAKKLDQLSLEGK